MCAHAHSCPAMGAPIHGLPCNKEMAGILMHHLNHAVAAGANASHDTAPDPPPLNMDPPPPTPTPTPPHPPLSLIAVTVCAAGTGGSTCTTCAQGFYSPGGTATNPSP